VILLLVPLKRNPEAVFEAEVGPGEWQIEVEAKSRYEPFWSDLEGSSFCSSPDKESTRAGELEFSSGAATPWESSYAGIPCLIYASSTDEMASD
jgi:hypothetical protein